MHTLELPRNILQNDDPIWMLNNDLNVYTDQSIAAILCKTNIQ